MATSNNTDLTETTIKCDEFKEIFESVYLSGKQCKILSEDEIYECNCNPLNGQNCGITCLNRMHFTECNPGYCAAGNKCKNRRFQNREWANIEVKFADKKGWGLFSKQNILKNQLVIEYCGEIIDMNEVQNRLQNQYFGSDKFFILSVGVGKFIDATIKGSKARFINHSCSPNCVTQKWIVLGQQRVGLFALRDIKIGEEITFDYQFQRYGEQRHPCHCGETNCRKFLGSTPNKTNKRSIYNKSYNANKPKSVITYRKMNEKIQFQKHNIYLKKLLNYNENIKSQLVIKGAVCNKLQLKSV
eukprot:401792_1